MINLIHILGQILFGGFFIMAGINHFTQHKGMTGYAQSLKVPSASFAVYFTGLMLIVGGLGVLFNMYLCISLIILVVFIIPVTFVAHAFWKGDEAGRSTNRIMFMKNLALLGAMLLMMQW